MIREHRSREKLLTYYDKYINEGVIDPNVHPWVAESWMKSKKLNVQSDTMFTGRKLSTEDFRLLQAQHKEAVDYLEIMVDNIREFFQKYNLCLLLLDSDCVVLKSYALPYFQMTAGEIEGVRVGIEEVGTSSISIAREHETPFWLFGPEMWVKDCQGGDACSAPVYMNGELSYMLTLVAVKQSEMPQDAVIAMLLTLGKSLEFYLSQMQRLQAQETILDATPFAVYHVMPGGDVAYANKLGLTRLAGIGAQKNEREMPNLSDVVMNYRHTPIYNGFRGVPSHNKEVTWITQAKTYEDITTVVPLGRDIDQAVSSVVVVSMPIEDLRTLVAHAAGYTAKYSLSSMVGEGTTFAAMKDKAARVAKNKHHVLIQGESGTGKQRLAHGIHQASPRAAGPLITLRCGDATPELLEQELFGIVLDSEGSHPGRLELASGGTLFLDEVEKMPKNIAAQLAKNLQSGTSCRIGERVERSIDVRIVAACDSDLKRLTERGLFDKTLYEIVSKSVIRVPSLRSRREDIPTLVGHIVKELAAQHQMQPKKILPETVKVLHDYDWPGNIKQLQSVLEYAFFNTKGDTIGPDDISLMGDIKPDNKWKEDREVFVKAWKAAGGNVSRLANLLSVSRVTLYRYLKKYGLEKS
ncbi:sigma 54-interacting transcriptional regulator [Schwartzia succinivorans]|jgi:DNA-binding NtrC family response regulator|uniref:DNA-binding transcriptional response regulator, NtrC family, contains REC, AAA-type ATPase, and a Fis-type DNA-binding domains n=1 Tax=Schwartzia succinivorans DSM 10502 TaxID=1123243 RepID=A0A1M4SYC1_9FIRM|nr:sigma 54-interacting transcriptional regulator [Schwartzia succinivorans]SHE37169.1 DNA-binding transcriptional response regulator, NtrC family, contains REC, AAA-type ATPase, and a Fis-type DNA-binding domains [Schwartzia succinivorans DSM 10502]